MSQNLLLFLPTGTDESDPDPADPPEPPAEVLARLAPDRNVCGQSTSASPALSASHAACPARRV